MGERYDERYVAVLLTEQFFTHASYYRTPPTHSSAPVITTYTMLGTSLFRLVPLLFLQVIVRIFCLSFLVQSAMGSRYRHCDVGLVAKDRRDALSGASWK